MGPKGTMTTTHGFIYVARGDADPTPPGIYEAEVGALVQTPGSEPPWIVVHRAISGVDVSSWPGRLRHVKIVEVAVAGMTDPALLPDPPYIRCSAVQIVDELEPSLVFGPHGAGMVEVIEVAQRLSLDQARLLAANDSPEAEAAYKAAWNAWIAVDAHSNSVGDTAVGRSGSPVGYGFLVLDSELGKRAQTVSGEAGVAIDDKGDAYLVAPWRQAGDALLHAAMALGAPRLTTQEGRAHLLRGWLRLVTGNNAPR
jgi:hypothetical protein